MRRRGQAWTGLGALLTMLLVGAPQVGAAGVTELAATIPSTTAHAFSSHPMISGTVASVNDHQLVVDTEQGERITLQVDSRTMAPRDLTPGMTVRTEFLALENCRFHADRVVAVRPGMSGQRLQAYANTRDHGQNLAYNASMVRARTAGTIRSRGVTSPGAVMHAMPGTADHYFSTRPLLSGTVLAVNDHRLVVETDQGRKVALVMDSRTLVPREVAPGSMLRAEFKEMNDGRFYAERVSLIGSRIANREQAYANTADNDVATAGIIGDCESVSPTPGNAVSSTMEQHPRAANTSTASYTPEGRNERADRDASTARDAEAAPSTVAPVADNTGTLPETASRRPLVLFLGLLALGSAGVITFVRLRTT